MNLDDRFARDAFEADTQFAHAFLREEALPEAGQQLIGMARISHNQAGRGRPAFSIRHESRHCADIAGN